MTKCHSGEKKMETFCQHPCTLVMEAEERGKKEDKKIIGGCWSKGKPQKEPPFHYYTVYVVVVLLRWYQISRKPLCLSLWPNQGRQITIWYREWPAGWDEWTWKRVRVVLVTMLRVHGIVSLKVNNSIQNVLFLTCNVKLACAFPALFSATHEYWPESISWTLVMTSLKCI